ncbi:putative SOS response-associated peptidase YedK [Salibacterium salarium]|uniref:SOS response-associated peptidase n=1 Tax=Salibacterium salarium TaxID=284579 RepID=UPI002785AD2D|nr:SOS response-associated peptidase [Salibacterium salarium]MDQ0300373.1 putative SOS response-associated peptidase YedK [Salibacterium salarium]
MCGRFTLTVNLEKIQEQLDVEEINLEDYKASYNIAPSQNILAVINDGENNRMGKLRWGLIPFWANDKNIGYKMINARAETVAEKGSFKHALKKRRCIIPADSFYEWKKVDGKKQPYRIYLKEQDVFEFAGLWEKWRDENDQNIFSCTIITTQANDFMSEIHNRMPVILHKKHHQQWMDPANQDPEDVVQLLQPIDSNAMTALLTRQE